MISYVTLPHLQAGRGDVTRLQPICDDPLPPLEQESVADWTTCTAFSTFVASNWINCDW